MKFVSHRGHRGHRVEDKKRRSEEEKKVNDTNGKYPYEAWYGD
jgi:hypothetical protein